MQQDNFLKRIIDAITKRGREVFIDGPNERGQQMMDAERARNVEMMRNNGLMDREGNIASSTNPDLFKSPVPFAPQMADFINRLQQARNK
jgi:hypothetical protein